MNSVETAARRIVAAHEYLRYLRAPASASWSDLYVRYSQGGMPLAEAMTLLDPQWLPDGILRLEAQGPRTFPDLGLSDATCGSAVIWGYPCDLVHLSRTQFDHLFPYALGGPTVAANRLRLCEVHNRVKGTDVHLFPWELGEPTFLTDQLARLARLILQ